MRFIDVTAAYFGNIGFVGTETAADFRDLFFIHGESYLVFSNVFFIISPKSRFVKKISLKNRSNITEINRHNMAHT